MLKSLSFVKKTGFKLTETEFFKNSQNQTNLRIRVLILNYL